MKLSKWDRVTYRGQAAEIIAVDPDPHALVHIVLLSDVDTLIEAERSELTAA